MFFKRFFLIICFLGVSGLFFLLSISTTTVVFTDHAPRKTIQILDLEAGLRQNHQCLCC